MDTSEERERRLGKRVVECVRERTELKETGHQDTPHYEALGREADDLRAAIGRIRYQRRKERRSDVDSVD